MEKHRNYAIFLLALGLGGCFNAPVSSIGNVSSARSGTQLPSFSEGTTDSKSIVTIDANSQEDIQLTAPAIEGLSGAGVVIPPGSLGVSVSIVVEEASDFSDTSMMSEMGITDLVGISSATPGMLVRPSENVDLKKPLSLSMPVPVGALGLAGGSNYAIFYKYFDPIEQRLMTGMKLVDGVNVKFVFDQKTAKDLLVFDGYFGAYWAVLLTREVKTEEVPAPRQAEEPLMNKAKVTVIASAGVVSETEIAKTQTIAPLVWNKTTLQFLPDVRSLKASVDATGKKIDLCKVDFFPSATAQVGATFDSPQGTDFVFQNIPEKAHTVVARFRCRDSLGRLTVTPWSDIVSVPGIAAPTGTTPPPTTTPAPTGDIVELKGKLVPRRDLLLVTMQPGDSHASFRDIPVDASGNFSIPVDRQESLGMKIRDRLLMNPINPDSGFYQDVANFFSIPLAEVTSEFNGATDVMIRDKIQVEVNNIISHGRRIALVAYTKGTDKYAEATSFKFLGYSTSDGRTLFRIPSKMIKTSLAFGDIAISASSYASTNISASAALNDSADMIEAMARMDTNIPLIRNAYTKNVWSANVSSVFKLNRTAEETVTSAVSGSGVTYRGQSFHLDRRNDFSIPFSDVCNSLKTFELLFPEPLSVNPGGSPYNVSLATNSSMTVQGSDSCFNDLVYYRSETDRVSFSAGNGGSIVSLPTDNYFIFRYEATEIERFLFSGADPKQGTSDIQVIVPTFQLIKTGNDFTGVKVIYYAASGSIFSPITNKLILARLLEDNRLYLRTSSNTEEKIPLTLGDTYEHTTTFTTPIPASTVTGGAINYRSGSQEFRFELNHSI